MIKVEVLEDFNLRAFDQLKNIVRSNTSKNEKGKLYKGDICECSKEMSEYLAGNNPLKKVVVKIIEVEATQEEIEETSVESVLEEIEKVEIKKDKPKRKKK